MLTDFQHVLDAILSEFLRAHAFKDDFLVILNGSELEHIALVEEILKKLDKEKMALKLEKSKFARKESEWLAHRIANSGITHLVRKTDPIDKPPPYIFVTAEVFYGIHTQPSKILSGTSGILSAVASTTE